MKMQPYCAYCFIGSVFFVRKPAKVLNFKDLKFLYPDRSDYCGNIEKLFLLLISIFHFTTSKSRPYYSQRGSNFRISAYRHSLKYAKLSQKQLLILGFAYGLNIRMRKQQLGWIKLVSSRQIDRVFCHFNAGLPNSLLRVHSYIATICKTPN